ncbi:type IV pilus modification protein PilV [Dokdonella soli]|uniref:Type IV pilus modification protein PilV n=2 Tax=Dokdonella soli TaxID=529810 RepID=A0ABN1IC22_9GAMM
MLEVLVAILVLSIGLLGLAALQAFSLKANQSANFRTQATALANLIVERMRAHGGGALNTTVAYYGAGSDARAQNDLLEWQAAIAAQLPNGVGTLVFNGGNIGVSITWTDARWAIGADQQTAFVLNTTL